MKRIFCQLLGCWVMVALCQACAPCGDVVVVGWWILRFYICFGTDFQIDIEIVEIRLR